MNSCARIGSDEKDAIGSGRRRAQEGNEIKNRQTTRGGIWLSATGERLDPFPTHCGRGELQLVQGSEGTMNMDHLHLFGCRRDADPSFPPRLDWNFPALGGCQSNLK